MAGHPLSQSCSECILSIMSRELPRAAVVALCFLATAASVKCSSIYQPKNSLDVTDAGPVTFSPTPEDEVSPRVVSAVSDSMLFSPQPLYDPVDVGPQRPHGQFPPGLNVDLGPQRPHGQFPPIHDPVDLGPQRPQGQFPPGSNVDLGPQRPHGQFPPMDDPVDVGPQRPQGQFPPGSNVDLGPQRPHGQSPPMDDPVDLGPQRPQGQFPPGSNVDLGPQRPHGQFPPRLNVDLGPQRPHGQFPPIHDPVDLGPQRPQGQFPPGSNVDLGPQRPHGQFPPMDDPVDVGSQRPQGQFPPGSNVDLGPQRPHGQSPPMDDPVDLGPQRPQGQFPPGSNVDLGPQRPHGQSPPIDDPVDLGPQRPQGQFPPGSNVDLGPQRPHGQFPPMSDPVDLGPHRPNGQLDPNGPKRSNGDLGPHRPQGMVDPSLPQGPHPGDVSVDLGPQRPQGELDPNGPKGSNGDLGPHRPQGMVDPNLPSGHPPPVDVGPQRPHGQHPPENSRRMEPSEQNQYIPEDVGPQRPQGQMDPNIEYPGMDLGPQRPGGQVPVPDAFDDGVTDNDFRIHWNVPTFMCHRYGYQFRNLSERYGVVQNENDVFRGDKIVILYDPGLYPALLEDNKGKRRTRNGGVPQEGNLTLHLHRFEEAVKDQVPENFNGLAVIDMEMWRPKWVQNWGTLTKYQDYSVEVERQRAPTASASTLKRRAKQRFEEAAKVFFLASLELAKKIRPRGKWGYYAYPYCFNQTPNQPEYHCSENVRKQNREMSWLWNASTAIYPSVYMSRSNKTAEDQFAFVLGRLQEALRVANGQRVYPYLWYEYHDTDSYVSDEDLRTSLTIPRGLRMAGAIMWGSSFDMNSKSKCESLNSYVENRMGPAIRKYTQEESQADVEHYVRQRSNEVTSS